MARVRGGVGLIVPGVTGVKDASGYLYEKEDIFLGPVREVIDEIHAGGAKYFFQLGAGFGRAQLIGLGPGMDEKTRNLLMVAPSDGIPNVWMPDLKHRGLTREEISKKSGGEFDKANAKESNENSDCYYLGEQSAIVGGKADIGAKMPVYLWIYYKDGKSSKLVYSIDPEEKVENADEKPVLEKLEKFLAENTPDGYSKKDGTPATGKGSFSFFNGDRESYIFDVSVSSGVGSTNFPVRLTAQTYKDRYGQ